MDYNIENFGEVLEEKLNRLTLDELRKLYPKEYNLCKDCDIYFRKSILISYIMASESYDRVKEYYKNT